VEKENIHQTLAFGRSRTLFQVSAALFLLIYVVSLPVLMVFPKKLITFAPHFRKAT
jgi:hypothetical protein